MQLAGIRAICRGLLPQVRRPPKGKDGERDKIEGHDDMARATSSLFSSFYRQIREAVGQFTAVLAGRGG